MALPVNGSTHLIPAYYSFYRPREDERLSWPSWLICSGWLTHISGHPSAAGRAQDRESSPARDRRSTTVPRHQLENYQGLTKLEGLIKSPLSNKQLKSEQNAAGSSGLSSNGRSHAVCSAGAAESTDICPLSHLPPSTRHPPLHRKSPSLKLCLPTADPNPNANPNSVLNN